MEVLLFAMFLNFIDLFAGCGGLSEGFLSSRKYKALAHIEWEKPMVNTLRNRLVKKWGHSVEEAKKRVILFDVQKTEELFYGNWSDESKTTYGAENHCEIISHGLDEIIGNPQAIASMIALQQPSFKVGRTNASEAFKYSLISL